MGQAPKTKTDLLSVKLFFVVLGAIAAYNVVNWVRGEPEWEERLYEPGAFAVQTAGRPNLRKLREPLSFGEVEFQYLMFECADVQYAIAYGDVPEAVQADSAIAARRDAILQKVEGTILSEAAVEMDGHPATADADTSCRRKPPAVAEPTSGPAALQLDGGRSTLRV